MSRFRYLFMYSGGIFFEMASFIVVVVVLGVIINYFVFSITPIKGVSMETNFHSGNWMILDKMAYLHKNPKRGDVVGLRFPGDPNKEKYIKRVIGLPGDKIVINNGQVYVNSQPLKEEYLPDGIMTSPDLSFNLADDQYYLMGDNRDNSSDSRIWGPANKNDFIGRARYVVFPLRDYKYVPSPSY